MDNFKIIDHSAEVIAAKDAAVERALEAIGQQAVGDVKLKIREPKPHRWGDATHPVNRGSIDTSRLINSITHDVDTQDESVVIGTNVEYAPYVEFGTRKSQAYPFMKPGIQENIKTYKEIAKQYLNGSE